MASLKSSPLFAPLRGLWRTRTASLFSLVSLTVGIGLATTYFALYNGIFISGLPARDADRLVSVVEANRAEPNAWQFVATRHFHGLRARQESLEEFHGYISVRSSLAVGDFNESAQVTYVTPGLLAETGVEPLLGRPFLAEDLRVDVAILSEGVWRDRMDADPGVVGRTLSIGGRPRQVVGVLPAGYDFPWSSSIWLPLDVDTIEEETDYVRWFYGVGRLREGVSLEQARAEFEALFARLREDNPYSVESDHPGSRDMDSVSVTRYLDSQVGEGLKRQMLLLGVAALAVLLVGCANAANLAMSRSLQRSRELAIRAALGASRRSLAGLLVSETLVLALLATLFGVGGAWWLSRTLETGVAEWMGHAWMTFRFDGTVGLFAGGLAFGATALSALYPAWRSSSVGISSLLNESSRGSSSLRLGMASQALVGAQLACSVAILAGLFLLLTANHRFLAYDLGLNDKEILVASVRINPRDYPSKSERQRVFMRLVNETEARPEFNRAALSWRWGLSEADNRPFFLPGRDYPAADAMADTHFNLISPGYFELFGKQLLEGRDFRESDAVIAPASASDPDSIDDWRKEQIDPIIINESFREKWFPGEESVIGKTVMGGGIGQTKRIIGVAPDMRMEGVRNGNRWLDDPAGYYYLQYTATFFGASLLVETAGPAEAHFDALRDAIREIDPRLSFRSMMTWREVNERLLSSERFLAQLLAIFGVSSVAIALVGLYGVASNDLARRRKEFGIRLALGATPASLVGLIARRYGLGTGLAILAGIFGYAAAARFLASLAPMAADPFYPSLVAAGTALGFVVIALAPVVWRRSVAPPQEALRE